MEVQEGNGLKLSQPLEVKVYLPISIKPALEELVDLHGLKNVDFYEEKPPENTIDIGGGVYIQR